MATPRTPTVSRFSFRARRALRRPATGRYGFHTAGSAGCTAGPAGRASTGTGAGSPIKRKPSGRSDRPDFTASAISRRRSESLRSAITRKRRMTTGSGPSCRGWSPTAPLSTGASAGKPASSADTGADGGSATRCPVSGGGATFGRRSRFMGTTGCGFTGSFCRRLGGGCISRAAKASTGRLSAPAA